MLGGEMAAAASDLAAAGAGRVTFKSTGQPELPANERLSGRDVVVTIDYFQTAGIPLLRGRTFTETDNADAPRVVVVNQEFVHRHLQDKEPLGKQIRLDVSGTAPEWREIVGVVTTVKDYSEDTRDYPEVYEPFLQRPVPSFSLMARTAADPNILAPALRGEVAQAEAQLSPARRVSMPEFIQRQKARNPFFVPGLGQLPP